MDFTQFMTFFTRHYKEMTENNAPLFAVEANNEELWNLYLDSFPAGKNEIYRERREYDCSACHSFFRAFANVVTISDMDIVSIWDFRTDDDIFQPVLDALSAYVHSRPIKGIFATDQKRVGTAQNHENTDAGIVTWNHFYADVPKAAIKDGFSIGGYVGSAKSSYDVLVRSLEEITMDSLDTVLELIAQNSLYRGEEHEYTVKVFKNIKKAYGHCKTERERECYCWMFAVSESPAVTHIRNHSIGTLLVDISEGMDLEEAVSRYEKIVAPSNYKRPKAIFTQRMLEDAKNTIMSLGYGNALARRHARLDDITANNILFCNRDSAKRVSGGNVFDEMMGEAKTAPKKFDRVQEIGIDDFVKNVLPTATEVEAYVENKHVSNFVSLIAPVDMEAKSMFKWDNAFCWAYSGNVADSELRRKVGELGGRLDGALRFSHTWNYDGKNQSLMDLHVFFPGYKLNGNENNYECHDDYPTCRRVGWNHRRDNASGAMQDVDFTTPPGNNVPVENTVFPDIKCVPEGMYTFKIHNWRERHPNVSGFKAEIEFDGTIYKFEYDKPVHHKEWITLAQVELKNGQFTMHEILPCSNGTKSIDIWGVKTNTFVPVSTVMYSPNYWDEQSGNGNKHVFFMLKGCVNPESPNGIYNEFLKPELEKHRRVFEALGSKLKVAESDDQLSGVGFSTTKRSELVVKVKGATERILKVKF